MAGIGYVPQDIFLVDDTIARNIAFGFHDKNIDLNRLREVCKIAQLLDFIENDLENNFESIVGERGTCFIGGQKQRIGLARALYHKPTILIMDEATNALDKETENRLKHLINCKVRYHDFYFSTTHRLIDHCKR